MSRRFDLLVLDVDGTFLTSRKQPSENVLAAVREAVAAGVTVTFATGRMFEASAGWVGDLGLTNPQIGNNGADIVNPVTGERFHRQCLDSKTVAWLAEQGRAADLPVVLFSGTRVLAEAKADEHWLLERNNEPVSIVSRNELLDPSQDVEKLLFLSLTRQDELSPLRDRLVEEAPSHIGFQSEVSEGGILNFCHPLATKRHALLRLSEMLSVPIERVAAVGDGDNDAEMLATAGLGIAMGNASPAAKSAAKLSVPDNDHDGLAYAIRTHVLAGE
jgi:Cof subfamily protein (haloacid dehalogenase superfamily)